MDTVISVQHLSKRYSRTGRAEPYASLRESLSRAFRPAGKSTPFWALNDVSFDVARGERIGIIGRNGAGKSTLLKIISRITPPTKGRIEIDGRVASLLEVGTGFHPELTGMENIFLNGSILGLSKQEISRKLDEIIAFSGVEAFINTPLKRYSSGMQLRLAFSVAAHLEAEVLLIDEVLAVGDAEFQQRCMGKMEEISREQGRTIVFVSHNMAALKTLCRTGLVLADGRLTYSGTVEDAVEFYTNGYLVHTLKTAPAHFDLRQHPNKLNADEGILSAEMLVNGQPSDVFIPGGLLKINVHYRLDKALLDPDVGLVIKDAAHNPLIGLNNKHLGKKLKLQTGREAVVTITIPELNLFRPGTYRVNLYFGDNHRFYECLYDAFEFTVPETDVYLSGYAMEPQWNPIFVPKLDIG